MYQNKLNQDGSLKQEYIQQLHSHGWNWSDITNRAQSFQEEYACLKALDETEPEPWVEYTADDLFSQETSWTAFTTRDESGNVNHRLVERSDWN